MEEIWKDVVKYENYYEVSNLGNVRNKKTKRILRPFIHKSGYAYVTLCNNGKQHNYRLNRVVAIAFIPNPNNLPVVNHKNLNKLDNCIDNLEWMTTRENNKHSYINQGRKLDKETLDGIRKRASKLHLLTQKKVGMYKEGTIIKEFESITKASQETKICRRAIHNRLSKKITSPLNGYEWRYING